MTAPADWRVLQAIKAVAEANGLPLDIRKDRHFFCSARDFAGHAKGRKSLRMEYFYREQRKRHGVLMRGDEPVGGSGTLMPTIARPSVLAVRATFRRAHRSNPMPSRAR